MRKLAAQLPLDRLLLGSDAPALAPERGARNEPANITHACRVVAELRGISEEQVARQTTENARRLFPNAGGEVNRACVQVLARNLRFVYRSA